MADITKPEALVATSNPSALEFAGRMGGSEVQLGSRLTQRLYNFLDVFVDQHGACRAVMPGSKNKWTVKVGAPALNNVMRMLAAKESSELSDYELARINQSLQAEAQLRGVTRYVYARVAPTVNGIEIDLGDPQHTRVSVSKDGREIISEGSEVLFVRSAVAKPMVMPAADGNLKLLDQYLNLNAPNKLLFLGWLSYTLEFASDYKTVLFDHVGAGKSDLTAYDEHKYDTLEGYADDLIDVCRAVGMHKGVFVGHSVSAMIGLIASLKAPELFESMIFVGPSPRYIDDNGYEGGFSEAQIEELLDHLASNHLGWSSAMAPVVMGNAERPELGEELTNSFCRTDPKIARHFARVTFKSDNRKDLVRVKARTLILQCSEDVIAPMGVGEFCRAHIPGSELVILKATGHCPNLSAPAEVVEAMRSFLKESA